MNKKEAEIVNREFVDRDDTYNRILGGGVGGVEEFARMGGIELHKQLLNDEVKMSKYRQTQSDNSKKMWKNEKIKNKIITSIRQYYETHDGPEKGKTGELSHNYGLIKIFNDETGECKAIRNGENIPDGWRRGLKKTSIWDKKFRTIEVNI